MLLPEIHIFKYTVFFISIALISISRLGNGKNLTYAKHYLEPTKKHKSYFVIELLCFFRALFCETIECLCKFKHILSLILFVNILQKNYFTIKVSFKHFFSLVKLSTLASLSLFSDFYMLIKRKTCRLVKIGLIPNIGISKDSYIYRRYAN